MVKVFCDACKCEITGSKNALEYLCHIDDVVYADKRERNLGYVDSVGNRISGRTVTRDLCNGCYNRVMVSAVMKIRSIQNDR
jgi:hypothetical protein